MIDIRELTTNEPPTESTAPTEQQISNELLAANIYPNYLGYRYLLDAILYIGAQLDISHTRMKCVYYSVAKAHRTTESVVERAIRYAVSKSTLDGLTNAQVTASIAEKLRLAQSANGSKGDLT